MDLDVEVLLERHKDKFRRLLRSIVAEEQGDDPFTYSLASFRALPDAGRAELVRRAAAIAADRIEHELTARAAAWVVILGDAVVSASTDPAACPSPEAVLRMGEPTGRVAYLFEAPLIEEVPATSRWAPLQGEDAYPTIPLAIGDTLVTADLDTGAHGTMLDADLVNESVSTWFAGTHLGQPFVWAPTAARLTFGSSAREMPIRIVRDWSASPFVRINPARRALVGRDLLRAFSLVVVLRSADAETDLAGSPH